MTCPFSYAEWTKGCGKCRGCGAELPRNKRTDEIVKTRVWCAPITEREWQLDYVCRDLWLRNHFWGYARHGAIRSANERAGLPMIDVSAPCAVDGVVTSHPEVNHIGPRYGGGYGDGCHNHQDNLEVLCHDHHVAVTGQQREARKHEGQAVMELVS